MRDGHWWEFKDADSGHALVCLIGNLLREEDFDEYEKDLSAFILPHDPKDPIEWDDEFAITVYARAHIEQEELSEYILDSDDTSRISGDFIEILENRKRVTKKRGLRWKMAQHVWSDLQSEEEFYKDTEKWDEKGTNWPSDLLMCYTLCPSCGCRVIGENENLLPLLGLGDITECNVCGETFDPDSDEREVQLIHEFGEDVYSRMRFSADINRSFASGDSPFTVSSTRYLKHRVCNSCHSKAVIGSWSREGRIFCQDCDADQPETQEPLSKEVWEYFVGKGAPKFYLRDVDEVANEAYSEGIFHTNFFRMNKAHPYEADMPENLRDICWIFYDQVRAKMGMMGEIEKYGQRGISEAHINRILNHLDHYLIDNPSISVLTVEDFQSICDCDTETAKSIFDMFAPEREEHEQRENLIRIERQNQQQKSITQLRQKLNLISDDEANRTLAEIRSRDPYVEYKKKRKESKMKGAAGLISETSERAHKWAVDLGLKKITGSQLALFFFEDDNRPDSPDVRRAILNQVKDRLGA